LRNNTERDKQILNPEESVENKSDAKKLKTLKTVFAMEYVLQGLANPFQGITYQPFFKHFRFDYGLSEAATQNMFSNSYLAWSFKPLIGFLIDAYGKTKVILTSLLSLAIGFYLLTPILDTGPMIFFGMMFSLSVVLAATDVAVDRATVVAGDEEARETGKSKSTTVGLNQAICWAAIYGTGIIAAVLGGYIADNVDINFLMIALAMVPLAVLIVVLFLPKDKAASIPLKESVLNFWTGLNTGPVLWIILFYFLFHFQPAMGALWTNYLIESLEFSQTQIGFADGAANVGFFLGVILFAKLGVHWQENFGLKSIFRIYILASVALNLTQYLLVDPWFSAITNGIAGFLPGVEVESVRLGYLATYNCLMSVAISIIRMSTFSLVGAVIPVAAAGSLFAGFMSVSNLAYSFSYSSGAWLYENGLNFGFVRAIQEAMFGIPGQPGAELSISMLILIGSMAYLFSFMVAHKLPDRKQTNMSAVEEEEAGPERWLILGDSFLKRINRGSLIFGFGFLMLSIFLGQNIISATLMTFFGVTILRKIALDRALRKCNAEG
jgi:MFS family permease